MADLIADGPNHLIIAGHFYGTITFGNLPPLVGPPLTSSTRNLFVARYVLNTRTWDWAVKSDGPGSIELQQNGRGLGLGTDAAGNVYIGGTVEGGNVTFGQATVVNSGNDSDAFVAKLSAARTWLWAKKATGFRDDFCNDIAVTPQGDAYVVGNFKSQALTLNPAPSLLNQGGPANDYDEIFVAKISSSGVWQDAVSGGSRWYDYGNGIVLGNSGNIFITGQVNETLSTNSPATFGSHIVTTGLGVLVAKLTDGASGLDWTSQVALMDIATGGGENMSYGQDIALDAAENLYIAGLASGSSPRFAGMVVDNGNLLFGGQAFAAQLSPTCRWQWVAGGGSRNPDVGTGVAVSPTGRVYVHGWTGRDQPITFGSASLVNTNQREDFFVAALDRTGGSVTVSSFTPAAQCGTSATQATINGTGFTPASIVLFNGISLTPQYVSPTQLRVTLPATTTSGPITVHNSAGTGLSATAFAVSAVPTATITPSGVTTFCTGGQVTLAAPTGTNLTYRWAPGNATTRTINATTASSYTVTVTNAAGCTATSAATVVTVNPVPPTPAITRTGQQLTCSATAGTYQWYRNGVLVTGVATRIFTPTQSGTYTVRVTQSGCQSALSAGFVYVVTGLPDELPGVSCALYPNPTTTGHLTVALTGHTQPLALTLLDALGRAVLTTRAATEETTLDVRALSRGVYVLRVVAPDGRGLSRQVVIE